VDSVSILFPDPPKLTAASFPPFDQTTRSMGNTLNAYFVLLNAEFKFKRYARNVGLDKLHPDMRALVEQTIHIVNLMYSQPVTSNSTAGARSDPTKWKEEHERKPLPFSWDTLSHEKRKALGRDLFSRGSAFRRRSTPEESEDALETHIPNESQRTQLPLARNQDIRDWAEKIH